MEPGSQISDEHDIGLGKVKCLAQAVSLVNMVLMQGIKKVFDAKGILNAGKVCHMIWSILLPKKRTGGKALAHPPVRLSAMALCLNSRKNACAAAQKMVPYSRFGGRRGTHGGKKCEGLPKSD